MVRIHSFRKGDVELWLVGRRGGMVCCVAIRMCGGKMDCARWKVLGFWCDEVRAVERVARWFGYEISARMARCSN